MYQTTPNVMFTVLCTSDNPVEIFGAACHAYIS